MGLFWLCNLDLILFGSSDLLAFNLLVFASRPDLKEGFLFLGSGLEVDFVVGPFFNLISDLRFALGTNLALEFKLDFDSVLRLALTFDAFSVSMLEVKSDFRLEIESVFEAVLVLVSC